MPRTLYVVCYDTPCSRRRRQMVRTLSRFGRRVQGSVFEVLLDGASLGRMTRHLSGLIDPALDNLIIYSAGGTRIGYGVSPDALSGESRSQVL